MPKLLASTHRRGAGAACAEAQNGLVWRFELPRNPRRDGPVWPSASQTVTVLRSAGLPTKGALHFSLPRRASAEWVCLVIQLLRKPRRDGPVWPSAGPRPGRFRSTRQGRTRPPVRRGRTSGSRDSSSVSVHLRRPRREMGFFRKSRDCCADPYRLGRCRIHRAVGNVPLPCPPYLTTKLTPALLPKTSGKKLSEACEGATS